MENIATDQQKDKCAETDVLSMALATGTSNYTVNVEPAKPLKKITKLNLEEEDDVDGSDTLESEAQDGHFVQPFGRKTVVSAPKYNSVEEQRKAEAEQNAQRPQPVDKRALLRARIRNLQNARAPQKIRQQTQNRHAPAGEENLPVAPDKKQRKQMAQTIKSKGIEGALKEWGVEDPGIQKIINDSVQTGEINNVNKITERVFNYYAGKSDTNAGQKSVDDAETVKPFAVHENLKLQQELASEFIPKKRKRKPRNKKNKNAQVPETAAEE